MKKYKIFSINTRNKFKFYNKVYEFINKIQFFKSKQKQCFNYEMEQKIITKYVNSFKYDILLQFK